MKVIAIIPAKSSSRRVPGKNMKPFNGRPLIFYTIVAALRSRFIDAVYVSTDSPEIKKYAEELGAQVPFLRPAHQSRDHVHSSVPIIDMLSRIGGAEKYSHCVSLLPTSPLRKTETIDGVVELSRREQKNVLTVASLGCTLPHLRTMSEDNMLEWVSKSNYNFQMQDSPTLLYLVGVAQCAPVRELLKEKTFQYGSPLGYLVAKIEAIDIDTEEDFIFAEQISKVL